MSRNVAIYARVSTEHEAQRSALENQVQYYDNILSMHPDWKLYKRYIDEGITGTSTKKRKKFLEMIEDAKNGCFDLIITREVSRFARNTVDTLQETRKLKKLGVEVYFTEDNIWTFNDEDGELKLTIMATLAQNESKKTSQRVKAGQKISFENGVLYGTGNILGYDRVGKELVVNEEQAKTVKFIYNECLDGIGILKIKQELEEKGMLTAMGLKKWNCATISRILHNSFYCGIIEYRKTYIPDYLEQKPKVNKGEVEKIIVEGKHEKIISKEDFDKVQKILSEKVRVCNNKLISKLPCKTVWGRKMICKCGSTLHRAKSHKYDNYILYHYECYRRKNNGKNNLNDEQSSNYCNMPYIQEWKLDLMANMIFKELCSNKTNIIKMANDLIDAKISSCQVCDNGYEIVGYNNKKAMIEQKKQRLIDLYLNQLISKDEFNSKKSSIDCELESVEKKIELLKSESFVSKEELALKLEKLKEIMRNNLYCSKNGDYVSEQLIDTFVKKIVVVSKNQFDWYLNCGDSKNELLGSIKITIDDVKKYTLDHPHYSKLRMKDDLIANIYI